jgi:hypothetical protein
MKELIGWREWISFPQLAIPAIKAKIDTGARTSALHAFWLEPFAEGGRRKVRFGIHPLQRNQKIEVFCEAEVIDYRLISDSGGHLELRHIIRTPYRLGVVEAETEISLTNRDSMLFRVLLGRTALGDRFLVDPAASYLNGRKLARFYRGQYTRKMDSK